MTIETIGRNNCSGCSLCSLVCLHQCISMQEDKEGFLQPIINHDICVDCGLCYKLCPCKEQYLEERQPSYYAASIMDKESLKNSSSGGIFIALASSFIKQGGYVCGCVFNENMTAEHICTNHLGDVKRMMGSKYVQSNITQCLKIVKELLQGDNLVLFTGTACQIAAVKRFTNNAEKLHCVDILCHGVPSPLFLRKYVQHLEQKHRGKLVRLEFRNKEKRGWGSEHRTYYEIEKNGNTKGYRPNLPAYFCAFFWGLDLRESCYNCKFTGTNRVSDITIGDFWGYWACFKKQFPEGISIVSVNSEKGKILFDTIKCEIDIKKELDQVVATGTNTNFYHPTIKPATRDVFYKGIEVMEYKDFKKRVFLDRTSRRKLLVSAYGCYVPEVIRRFVRNHIRKTGSE